METSFDGDESVYSPPPRYANRANMTENQTNKAANIS